MECAGVAAGSKMLVGEPAEARRALASKATKGATTLVRAEARFLEPAILANRFMKSKSTCVTPPTIKVVQRTETGRAGGKRNTTDHDTTKEPALPSTSRKVLFHASYTSNKPRGTCHEPGSDLNAPFLSIPPINTAYR